MSAAANKSLAAGTLALILCAACSTKSSDGGDSTSADGLKTDVGVSDSEIRLAVMTDLSGPYKAGGLAIAAGNQLWADTVNSAGGICGRDIVLDMQDTVYKVDVAVPQYASVAQDDLGVLQLGGSHILSALKEKMTADDVLSTPAGWAAGNLDREQIMLVGQTCDVEMINGLSFMQEQGMLADGDKIGHIWQDAEYGQNGKMAVDWYAEQHDLDVVSMPISTTDTDMTATVTKLKSEGVDLIAITTTPAATGSIALQNAEQGLSVPMIGNNQAFQPQLLDDPAMVDALSDFYMVSSTAPFSADLELSKQIAEDYADSTDDEPSVGVPMGYSTGMVWEAVLNEACDSGDMTRKGVLEAKKKVTSLDTEGLTGTLDFSKDGEPSTREAF
ncbi:MAG: ABC transporter substrate-binding protein, partial [Cumulibacter sp.]